MWPYKLDWHTCRCLLHWTLPSGWWSERVSVRMQRLLALVSWIGTAAWNVPMSSSVRVVWCVWCCVMGGNVSCVREERGHMIEHSHAISLGKDITKVHWMIWYSVRLLTTSRDASALGDENSKFCCKNGWANACSMVRRFLGSFWRSWGRGREEGKEGLEGI